MYSVAHDLRNPSDAGLVLCKSALHCGSHLCTWNETVWEKKKKRNFMCLNPPTGLIACATLQGSQLWHWLCVHHIHAVYDIVTDSQVIALHKQGAHGIGGGGEQINKLSPQRRQRCTLRHQMPLITQGPSTANVHCLQALTSTATSLAVSIDNL